MPYPIVSHALDAGCRANGWNRPACNACDGPLVHIVSSESEVTCYQCRKLARSKHAWWSRWGLRVDRFSIAWQARKNLRGGK